MWARRVELAAWLHVTPNPEWEVATWIAAVAASAPEMPVYYYHIDCMTGVSLNCEALLKQIEALTTRAQRPMLSLDWIM